MTKRSIGMFAFVLIVITLGLVNIVGAQDVPPSADVPPPPPPTTGCPFQAKPLYTENFDDQLAQGFSGFGLGSWGYEAIDGRGYVLVSQTSQTFLTRTRDDYDNAVWFVDVRPSPEQTHLNWHFKGQAGDVRYIITISDGIQIIHRESTQAGENVAFLAEVPFTRPAEGEFVRFAVTYFNGVIDVWANDQLVASAVDPQPLESGSIGLEVPPNSAAPAAFDNIVVCGLDQPYAPEQLTMVPTPTPVPTVPPREVSGHFFTNQTWRGEIHVVGDVVVEQGATLTILPRTTVRVAANTDANNLITQFPEDLQQGIAEETVNGVIAGEPYRDEENHISIFVLGTLNAVGTAEEPITITSDSPTPGIYDWNRLHFDNGILSHAVVEYYRILDPGTGTEISNSTLRYAGECSICAGGDDVLIENNTFFYAGHELIDMHGGNSVIQNNVIGPNTSPIGTCIIVDGGAPTIVNNVIDGCSNGIVFISPPGSPVIEGNTFTNNLTDIHHGY